MRDGAMPELAINKPCYRVKKFADQRFCGVNVGKDREAGTGIYVGGVAENVYVGEGTERSDEDVRADDVSGA